VLGVLVVVLAAGCGGDDGEPDATGTGTGTLPAETHGLSVYLLRDGRVWPVRREVEDTPAVARIALDELLEGPSQREAAELEATTGIPDGSAVDVLTIEDGVATVALSSELGDDGLAQVVYTVTQFPTVETVDIQGRSVTRADFEEQTPSVLVESPLAFDTVSPPFDVTGTANTFEATFNYEVTNVNDFIVAEDFVTATSGSGTRGTFEFTAEFVLEAPGAGSLTVFELSAEDGSRIHDVRIPLELAP
jgi:hypothetical protein